MRLIPRTGRTSGWSGVTLWALDRLRMAFDDCGGGQGGAGGSRLFDHETLELPEQSFGFRQEVAH